MMQVLSSPVTELACSLPYILCYCSSPLSLSTCCWVVVAVFYWLTVKALLFQTEVRNKDLKSFIVTRVCLWAHVEGLLKGCLSENSNVTKDVLLSHKS